MRHTIADGPEHITRRVCRQTIGCQQAVLGIGADEFRGLALHVNELDRAFTHRGREEGLARRVIGDRFDQRVTLGQGETQLATAKRIQVGLQVEHDVVPDAGTLDLVEARVLARVKPVARALQTHQHVITATLVVDACIGSRQLIADRPLHRAHRVQAFQRVRLMTPVFLCLELFGHARQHARVLYGIELPLGRRRLDDLLNRFAQFVRDDVDTRAGRNCRCSGGRCRFGQSGGNRRWGSLGRSGGTH